MSEPNREQITAATFDRDHPNPEHMPGVVYDPRQRCAYIQTPSDQQRADLGDWIIRQSDGSLTISKGASGSSA